MLNMNRRRNRNRQEGGVRLMLHLSLLHLNELLCFFLGDDSHKAGLALKDDTEELVSCSKQFRMESRDDELRFLRLLLNHVRNCRAVHRVERCIDLIQQVERRRITALNGKDQTQRNDTLLTARKLMAVGRDAGEGNLKKKRERKEAKLNAQLLACLQLCRRRFLTLIPIPE
jgi:hypothetical protein